MIDPATLITGGQLAISAGEKLKGLVHAVKKSRDTEVLDKVRDLQIDVIQLIEANGTLRDQVHKLSEAKNLRDRLRSDKNMYWLGSAEETKGPFCRRCFDSDGNLQHMDVIGTVGFGCPHCACVLDESGDPAHIGVVNRFLRAHPKLMKRR